ncbi:hypothetical protein L1987_41865 [Smallanthus sonchifolius]|uniref:Uncharacterized protein n=1 Tax=Smallanthus sonchifolius TaxID=185202 RepID=A0ACB9GVL6_9ASTR|nr:hypothetical protein L1987_41865 [Smallanthus sonchifolius]
MVASAKGHDDEIIQVLRTAEDDKTADEKLMSYCIKELYNVQWRSVIWLLTQHEHVSRDVECCIGVLSLISPSLSTSCNSPHFFPPTPFILPRYRERNCSSQIIPTQWLERVANKRLLITCSELASKARQAL